MIVACLDLEGVLIPEIWVNVAERAGIDALKLTTRDIPDYDELMTHRLKVLDEHGLGMKEIQEVIGTLEPLPGAPEFLRWLTDEGFETIILSDTFYEFARPLMPKLGDPTLFCHHLEVNEAGRITAYKLRQQDQKRHAVNALKGLNFSCIAAGDSYNDTSMLGVAHAGIFYQPPQNVIEEFPQYPVTRTYEELQQQFLIAKAKILSV